MSDVFLRAGEASPNDVRLYSGTVGTNTPVAMLVESAFNATMVTSLAFVRTLGVTSAMTATMVRDIAKGLSVTSAMTATIVKGVSKAMLVTAPMTTSISKEVGKMLTVSSAFSATIGDAVNFLRSLSASSPMTGAIGTTTQFGRGGGVAGRFAYRVLMLLRS